MSLKFRVFMLMFGDGRAGDDNVKEGDDDNDGDDVN